MANAALCWAAATTLLALFIADWMAELALKAAETDAADALLLAIPSDSNAADERDCWAASADCPAVDDKRENEARRLMDTAEIWGLQSQSCEGTSCGIGAGNAARWFRDGGEVIILEDGRVGDAMLSNWGNFASHSRFSATIPFPRVTMLPIS